LEDAHQRLFAVSFLCNRHRNTTHQRRYHAVLEQIVLLDFAEHLRLRQLLVPRRGAVESNLAAACSGFDDLLQSIEGATANEENVLRVELDILLLRVLATPLWWNGSDGSFDDFEQRLLHALARDVACDTGVFR